MINDFGGTDTFKVKFPGMERFKGPMFHTARWNHTVDYKNKRMVKLIRAYEWLLSTDESCRL